MLTSSELMINFYELIFLLLLPPVPNILGKSDHILLKHVGVLMGTYVSLLYSTVLCLHFLWNYFIYTRHGFKKFASFYSLLLVSVTFSLLCSLLYISVVRSENSSSSLLYQFLKSSCSISVLRLMCFCALHFRPPDKSDKSFWKIFRKLSKVKYKKTLKHIFNNV